ncbi:MAG: hypothetical protein M1820_006223 [Bogoriella megaspora]|nr:MAG: hypothetical protein M1820_006223 [Bogoriella megaspora]
MSDVLQPDVQPRPAPQILLPSPFPLDNDQDQDAEHLPQYFASSEPRDGAADVPMTANIPKPAPSKIPRLKNKSSSSSNPEATLDPDDHPYPTASTSNPLLPPPDFRPLFTLIEDSVSGEHHHPAVHYVFADDDPEVLTHACLQALDPSTRVSAEDEDAAEPREERAVIIDLGPDAKTVIGAQSLSPDWQVLNASLDAAPTWDDAGGGGLMLRVGGMGAVQKEVEAGKDKGKGKGKARGDEGGKEEMLLEEARKGVPGGDVFQGMGALVERVRSGMEALGKVVGPDGEGLDEDIEEQAE